MSDWPSDGVGVPGCDGAVVHDSLVSGRGNSSLRGCRGATAYVGSSSLTEVKVTGVVVVVVAVEGCDSADGGLRMLMVIVCSECSGIGGACDGTSSLSYSYNECSSRVDN